LKPYIQIRVIEQVVILDIRRQEKIMGKREIDPWTDKKKFFLAVILRKFYIIVIHEQGNISVGLVTDFQLRVHIEVGSVIEAAIGGLKNVIKDPARVTFKGGRCSVPVVFLSRKKTSIITYGIEVVR
jgi:hypothetical protein